MTLVRRLRVIEYIGTPEWMDKQLEGRNLKGSRVMPGGSIREAWLGDTNEVMLQAEVDAIAEARLKKDL